MKKWMAALAKSKPARRSLQGFSGPQSKAQTAQSQHKSTEDIAFPAV
jgi:hypothetical protein